MCSSVCRSCRLCSTANRVLDASKEDVLVAEDLKEEGGERTPSHLMSSLLSSPVSAGELLLVRLQMFRVNPAVVVVHPRYVDILHVSFAEDGVGGHVSGALQVASSLLLDDL